eukprot:3940689-Rhodomonas_salina.1
MHDKLLLRVDFNGFRGTEVLCVCSCFAGLTQPEKECVCRATLWCVMMQCHTQSVSLAADTDRVVCSRCSQCTITWAAAEGTASRQRSLPRTPTSARDALSGCELRVWGVCFGGWSAVGISNAALQPGVEMPIFGWSLGRRSHVWSVCVASQRALSEVVGSEDADGKSAISLSPAPRPLSDNTASSSACKAISERQRQGYLAWCRQVSQWIAIVTGVGMIESLRGENAMRSQLSIKLALNVRCAASPEIWIVLDQVFQCLCPSCGHAKADPSQHRGRTWTLRLGRTWSR